MNYISSRRRTRRGPLKGDVQEEGQGEEWSDTGCHPPWHLPACLCAHLMFTSFFLYPNKSFQPEPSPLTQRRWTSSRTSGGTSGITSGSQMDPGRVKYESGVIN